MEKEMPEKVEKNAEVETRSNKYPRINTNVILSYGVDAALEIAELLLCNNTEEKLESIKKVMDMQLDGVKKLFIIQKLLSLPKVSRTIISEKIILKLKEKEEDESKS